jgi:hypothetical protein
MKPKSFSVAGAALVLVGLAALAPSCSKNAKSLETTPLSPITTADPSAPSVPLGTSTGAGYAQVFDEVIHGASTSIEITEWAAFTSGEHNQVAIAVEPGYVMVGGGAQTADPGGNPNNVDAVLTAAYPVNDGTFSTYVADNKDHGNIFYTSDLYAYVIGMKLIGPGGVVVPTSTLIPHMYMTSAQSISADHPIESISTPSGIRILSGGALDDYTTGYGNLLVEDDWTTSSTTASGKDQKVADVCPIDDYLLGIDNNSIAGFGTLNVQNFSAFNNVTNHLQTITVTIPSGWGVTGVGGKSTYSGYGRLLYNMYAQSATQVVVSTKDQDVNDVSGTISVIASAVQPAQ